MLSCPSLTFGERGLSSVGADGLNSPAGCRIS